MIETVYSAAPQLSQPRGFLKAALHDGRASLSIGWRLFWSNSRSRYRRAWLGYVWLFVPALATALVAGLIQSREIVSFPPTELPYRLFVFSGIILWQLLVEALNAPLVHLRAGRQLVTRSRVPHEALLIAGLLEVLLNGFARLLVLIAAMVLFGEVLYPQLVLLPFIALAIAVLGLGIGLLIAPLGLLYDDVGDALALCITFGFFVTPVVYPFPQDSVFRWNPAVPLFDAVRASLVGAPASSRMLAVGTGAILLLLLAWLIYRLARPHVVARLP